MPTNPHQACSLPPQLEVQSDVLVETVGQSEAKAFTGYFTSVDCLEELGDEFRGEHVPAFELVRGLQPPDASVSSSDKAVETRHHVDRYAP